MIKVALGLVGEAAVVEREDVYRIEPERFADSVASSATRCRSSPIAGW